MLTADIGRIPWTARSERGVLHGLWSRTTTELTAFAAWLRRARCGLGGHMMVLHFEPQRVALECVGCGKQTPGWSLDTRG
jgi:hypothetical protein